MPCCSSYNTQKDESNCVCQEDNLGELELLDQLEPIICQLYPPCTNTNTNTQIDESNCVCQEDNLGQHRDPGGAGGNSKEMQKGETTITVLYIFQDYKPCIVTQDVKLYTFVKNGHRKY